MSKHTPGPWKFDGCNNIVTSHEAQIGIAKTYHNIGQDQQANAHLIAAAPDLLEAANRLINCHTGASWQTQEIQREAWLSLATAIAKAEAVNGTRRP